MVLLVAAVVLFILRWKYRLSLLYFFMFFIFPLAIFYLVLPLIARKMFPELDRQVRILHMKGKWEDALSLYKKNLFLRAFGPAAEMKKLLGRIHAFLFKWESSRKAFEDSLGTAGASPDLAAVAGYGEACFHTGRDREAERALGNVTSQRIPLPQTVYYKIHLLLEDDKKSEGARSEYESFQWDEEKDKPIKLLVLSEIQAEEGKLDKACDTLKQVDRKKLPRPLRYMARLLEGRLLFIQEKTKEARKILTDVARNTPSGRHLIEVEDFEIE